MNINVNSEAFQERKITKKGDFIEKKGSFSRRLVFAPQKKALLSEEVRPTMY
jgi:hypothetical protein